jgi:hypothetical protein
MAIRARYSDNILWKRLELALAWNVAFHVLLLVRFVPIGGPIASAC